MNFINSIKRANKKTTEAEVAEKKLAEEAARVAALKNAAFDNARNMMMIVDRANKVVFASSGMKSYVAENQEQLNSIISRQAGTPLEGAVLNLFPTEPGHQDRIFANSVVSPFTGNVAAGNRILQVSVSALNEADGSFTGNVVEWVDVTQSSHQAGLENALNRSQAVIEFTLDGTILDANDLFLGAVGYSREEIVGKHHSIFIDDAYATSAEYKEFWAKLGRGEFDAGKYRRFGKGKNEIWIQAAYNPIMDDEGKPYKVVKFASDITAEEALAKEAIYKSAAFEGISVAMMMIDRDFNITHMNPSLVELFKEQRDLFSSIWPGFDPENLVGQCIDKFHKDPSHQRRLLSDPSRLPYSTDIKVGEIRFALSVSAVMDKNGNYVGNCLEWDDVTEKRTHAGILQALDRSQAIIEFNMDGKILAANEQFLQTVGYTEDEIVGKHHSMFATEELKHSEEYKDFWRKLNNGEFDAGKYHRVGKGGKDVWIQAAYSPIVDRNGTPFKVIKMASDVTDVELATRRHEEETARTAEAQMQVVDQLAFGLQRLSEGDLTVQLDQQFEGKYEQLRADFNVAVQRLQEVMQGIINNSDSLKNGAHEISQAADDLSRRTEHQAATLEETAAALEEITATVNAAADGAHQANLVVTETRQSAEESGKVVREAVSAMTSIKQSSDQISQIIGVIDEIAFQTNLLALNAGVEAARAGEAGRGFAVVASEVRALAQRSSDAAKEIKELISTSSTHVDTGVDLVGQAGQALEQIVTKVVETNSLVSDISVSAQEQATGLKEINVAVSQMDQVTQQNAAMVEESTAASHSMTQEALGLAKLVGHFQTAGGGISASVPSSMPRSQPDVHTQQQRAASFATNGSAALNVATVGEEEDWEEF